ncbi:MAG TPA: beta-galactosidase, partial [Terriglobia bacterium]|nr:beta-galactosidase [Terriglobia bacterium]
LDRIRKLTISLEERLHPLTIYFDNFRLCSGAEDALTSTRKAPQDSETILEGRWVTIRQVGPRDKIPENATVRELRRGAQAEYQALQSTIEAATLMGLDTIYSQAKIAVAELGLNFRPTLAWFNNDHDKEQMFRYATETCRRERERLEKLLRGEVRLPERDDTQIAGPLVPPYPRLHGLASKGWFFVNQDDQPLHITSLHGPSQVLQKFFATPLQHIESYSVGGGSRWTIEDSPVFKVFQQYPDSHRVGWDGWCGHLIRTRGNIVICLEDPHIREAVERYIEREVNHWLKNPDLLYNVMAYELMYICYCERSQQMFRAWLEKKHGTLMRLNQAWETHYQSFPEIVAPPTKDVRPLPGTNRAQWYDWASFNQDRFTDYLAWVKSVIRRFDPVTPLATGGSYSMLVGSNGTSGIDEEQIINRIDDVIIHEGSGSTLGMDLQMALSEKPKPLCDPEMNLGEIRYLLPHMLHGKSVIQIWHWQEQVNPEYPHQFTQSLAHAWKFSLEDVSALFRAVLDSRRLSKEIAAFVSAPAEVAILYSRTSMLQIPPEMLTWQTTPYLRELGNCYEAGRFLDTRTTFVTENQILAGKLSRFKVLIVPGVSHMRADVIKGIYRFVEQGGTLVMLPSSFLSDEYNRPADYLSQIGVRVRRIEQPQTDQTGEVEQAYDQSFHQRVVYRSQPAVDLNIKPTGLFASATPKLQAEGTRQEVDVSGPYQSLADFPNGQAALVSLNRGRGVIYYSATSFPRFSLNSLLDRILDAAQVDRPLRVREENGRTLGDVEARYVSTNSEKLMYLVNLNETPVSARIELDGKVPRRLFELRKQMGMSADRVSVAAGETLIFKVD